MAKTGWKRLSYGGYYKVMPDGETCYIERSLNHANAWHTGGRTFSYLAEAKEAVDAEYWENEKAWMLKQMNR